MKLSADDLWAIVAVAAMLARVRQMVRLELMRQLGELDK